MVDGLHVSADKRRRGSGLMNLKDIRGVHDHTTDAENLCVATVEDDDLRLVNGDCVRDLVVPNSVGR